MEHTLKAVPDWWLETAINVFCCVAMAYVTGGDPVLKVCDDHLHYGVRYKS